MNKHIQKIHHFRKFILQNIETLSIEQLNEIPQGLNNNIIWNLGHLIASAQMIFYKRAGLPFTIDEKYITPFLPNSRPDGYITATDVENLKDLALSTIENMQTDYHIKDFNQYIKSENIERVYGIEVLTIDDALEFLLYHEGYHTGKIISLKQLILKE
ncbi:DinB family protein [Haliscomenobacter sp.]|uniref:DinB family protein n=1 Tax=Haliscomenobacter sp. TaxID=2717303 RepID=UPI003BA894D3